PREVDHVLFDSGAKILFVHSSLAETASRLARGPQQLPFEGPNGLEGMLFGEGELETMEVAGAFESPVMILYTSGTTGSPKGALITNKMLFWSSVNTGLRLNITQADVTVLFHPLFHTSGWNVLTTPFFHHGATVVMLKKFDPRRVLALCESEKVSILFGVP